MKHTLTATTKWIHNAYCIPIHKHFKSFFSAASVSHHHEPVTTITKFSNEPGLGNNATTVEILELVLRDCNLGTKVMEVTGGQCCTKLRFDHGVKEFSSLHFVIIMEFIIRQSPEGRDEDDLPITLEAFGSHSRTNINSRAQPSTQLFLWLGYLERLS